MPPAIQLMNVAKAFRRWESWSLKQLLLQGMSKGPRQQVLTDISLTISAGEFVGLIGPNGSGKSTLFRLMSGIFPPDRGTVKLAGPVAPLIELYAGFHPDLTGMENLFLNASILGLSNKAIKERAPAIIDYAEMHGNMDKPTRFYSSGMLSRLGFAITIFVDAEILLIDEVLSVGDEAFQQRCLATLREKHRAGNTIVFVSHDLPAVVRETQRTVWLEGGGIAMDGPSAEVVAKYKEKYSAPAGNVAS